MIKGLRKTRAAYRRTDTAGEKIERELDRLIKRKTRINANSLVTLSALLNDFIKAEGQIGAELTLVFEVASRF